MRLSTFRRLGGEAWVSLRRNKLMSLASIGTVFVTLLVLGIFLLIASNVGAMAADLESQVEITAYLQNGLTEASINGGMTQIQQLPGVREANYVSKAAALEELRVQFGTEQDLLEAVEGMNPLRDSFRIKLVKPEDSVVVAEAVGKLAMVSEVKYRQDTVEKLLRVTRAIRTVGAVLVGLLVLVTVFVISNTIRLTVFARRREISIMKLVGATDWYIRWPFLLEGMLIGFIGATGSSLLLYFGYGAVVASWQETLPFLPLVAPARLIRETCLWLLVVGSLVGIVGSTLSLRRYLYV